MLGILLAAVIAQARIDPTVLSPNVAETAQITPQQAFLHSLEGCESGGDPTKAIVDTNGYWSRGVLQFQLSTWIAAGERYGIETSRANIFDPDLQEQVATRILDDGGWSNWYTCYRKTAAKLGEWPD